MVTIMSKQKKYIELHRNYILQLASPLLHRINDSSRLWKRLHDQIIFHIETTATGTKTAHFDCRPERCRLRNSEEYLLFARDELPPWNIEREMVVLAVSSIHSFDTQFPFNFSDNSEAVQNCIQSIIKLVKLIYEEVQSLEAIRLPVNIEAKYQPLEDLKDCIYFQRDVSQFGASDIKVSESLTDRFQCSDEMRFVPRISSTFFCISNRNC